MDRLLSTEAQPLASTRADMLPQGRSPSGPPNVAQELSEAVRLRGQSAGPSVCRTGGFVLLIGRPGCPASAMSFDCDDVEAVAIEQDLQRRPRLLPRPVMATVDMSRHDLVF
jgi:hypothetical protein